MKEYKILFWYKPFPQEDDFVKDTNHFLTSALIKETRCDGVDIFHVRLLDIGLNSLYGEFDITRKDGYWQTFDIDGSELNYLKTNIGWTLEFMTL